MEHNDDYKLYWPREAARAACSGLRLGDASELGRKKSHDANAAGCCCSTPTVVVSVHGACWWLGGWDGD